MVLENLNVIALVLNLGRVQRLGGGKRGCYGKGHGMELRQLRWLRWLTTLPEVEKSEFTSEN